MIVTMIVQPMKKENDNKDLGCNKTHPQLINHAMSPLKKS